MQKDANEERAAADAHQAYDLTLKRQSLKLLLDYSAATGRKWKHIRDEIIDVTQAPATEHIPLLTRQDLEAWARGDSTLGDGKFQWVMKFLTHPSTLERPEFHRALDILNRDGALRRIGNAVTDLYFTPPVPDLPGEARYLRRYGYDESWPTIAGTYFWRHLQWNACLSLNTYERANFLIAHLLTWINDDEDWVEPLTIGPRLNYYSRYSGIATPGQIIRLHLKNPTTQVALTAFAHHWTVEDTPVIGLMEGSKYQHPFTTATLAGLHEAYKEEWKVQQQLFVRNDGDEETNKFIESFRYAVVL